MKLGEVRFKQRMQREEVRIKISSVVSAVSGYVTVYRLNVSQSLSCHIRDNLI